MCSRALRGGGLAPVFWRVCPGAGDEPADHASVQPAAEEPERAEEGREGEPRDRQSAGERPHAKLCGAVSRLKIERDVNCLSRVRVRRPPGSAEDPQGQAGGGDGAEEGGRGDGGGGVRAGAVRAAVRADGQGAGVTFRCWGAAHHQARVVARQARREDGDSPLPPRSHALRSEAEASRAHHIFFHAFVRPPGAARSPGCPPCPSPSRTTRTSQRPPSTPSPSRRAFASACAAALWFLHALSVKNCP